MSHGYGAAFRSSVSVELWDDEDRHVEELIALTGDYWVARAAFDESEVPARSDRDAAAENQIIG
jgi:hypothetical protein